MSPRRVSDWQIKPGDDGNYHLFFRNKSVLEDRSMTEINKHLRKHREQGQTVHEVADDGYVTDHTKRIDRRQRRQRSTKTPHRPVRMPLLRF